MIRAPHNLPCHVWVCAVVDVEHQGVSTFDQNRCGGLLSGVDERDSIDDIIGEFFAVYLERTSQSRVHFIYDTQWLTLNLDISSSTS